MPPDPPWGRARLGWAGSSIPVVSMVVPCASAAFDPSVSIAAENRRPILPRAQLRPHLPQRASRKTVGDDRLQSIADFDAALAIAHGEQEHRAFVFAFFSHAPLAIQCVGEILNRGVIQRIDGNYRELRAGSRFHRVAILLQSRLVLGRDYIGEVADVALRF